MSEPRGRGTLAGRLSEALDFHRKGKLARAAALYEEVLERSPDQPDALHLLGVIAAARGDTARATALIGKSLVVSPRVPDAHSNLGNVFRAAGRCAEAIDCYRRAIGLRPDFAEAYANLGLVLCDQGDFVAATANCDHAVKLSPTNLEANVNLAHVLRKSGRVELAESALREAAERMPRCAELQIQRGDALMEMRKFAPAGECYGRAVELDPRSVRALRGLAASLRSVGEVEAAIVHYRHALGLETNDAATWNDLGRCFLARGRIGEAVRAFRRALGVDADWADAYRNLAACRALSLQGPEFARVGALASRTDLPDEQAAAARFAMAKALDDAGRCDEAFAAYETANGSYRKARALAGDRFDAEDLARRVDALIGTFDSTFFNSVAGWGDPCEKPVFIVGLPRSGTSLVEQIVASHSKVFGAGELRAIGEIAARIGWPAEPTWTRGAVRDAAKRHIDELNSLGGGAERVVDKLPDNIFMLGLIATLYPAARIIFCERDPRDVGVSCFFQKFSTGSLTFSYDLADCGARIRETRRLADHWKTVLPLRVIEVRYEALVAEVDRESRRLIAFLGLNWEPACLDFQRTSRVVQTASAWQVRQPLYREAVGRWRRYERHLGRLFDELAIK